MAIAFDNVLNVQDTTASSQTTAYTTSGSYRMLFVGLTVASATDIVTSVTYAGVSMARFPFVLTINETNSVYLFLLQNPTVGANNIVVTLSSSARIRTRAVSYNGCNQSNFADSSNTGQSASASSISATTTTIADNCWALAYMVNFSGDTVTPNAGTTIRGSDGLSSTAIGDSNGVIHPPAATALGYSWASGAAPAGIIIVSFAPLLSRIGRMGVQLGTKTGSRQVRDF